MSTIPNTDAPPGEVESNSQKLSNPFPSARSNSPRCCFGEQARRQCRWLMLLPQVVFTGAGIRCSTYYPSRTAHLRCNAQLFYSTDEPLKAWEPRLVRVESRDATEVGAPGGATTARCRSKISNRKFHISFPIRENSCSSVVKIRFHSSLFCLSKFALLRDIRVKPSLPSVLICVHL